MTEPATPYGRPESERRASGTGAFVAAHPAGPPGSEASGPALGAPPPAIGQPPPAAPATPQPATAAPVPAVPAPAAPQTAQPAEAVPAAGTAATTRLSGRASHEEANATILLGGSAGQSAGAARAATVAAPKAAAAAVSKPAAADRGTVYGGGNGPRGEINPRALRGVRPLAALHVGTHIASERALDEIRFSSPGTGMLLGHDRDRKPVQVRLFRAEPTRLAAVGGLWLARVLVFRALGLGSRVVIFTGRPEQWNGFGEWATGRSDRVAVLPAERPVAVTATARTPVLLVYDVGLLGAANRPALAPWQTQLTVLSQLTAYGFPAIQESHLVAMQRLSDDEARSVSSVMRLTPSTTQLLTALRDDMIALVGGGADRYVWLNATAIERNQFGAPHR